MTLRADAVRVLRAWQPSDPPQDRLRRDYLDHLCRHPDGMWRTCREAHLTASALVVDPSTAQVLLTLHPKVGRWLQTGGHCERNDATLAEAALREAVEESGIAELTLAPHPVHLDRHEVACGGPGSRSVHLDVQYVAIAPAGAAHRRGPESLDLAWFPATELPQPTDQALGRLVSRAAAQLA